MLPVIFVCLAAAVGLLIVVLRLRSHFPQGLKAGDLVKVDIPRELGDGPLAMGTRMDILAALKRRGVPAEELRALASADDDRALLAKYWAEQPATEDRTAAP
jgi:hypothetical protein